MNQEEELEFLRKQNKAAIQLLEEGAFDDVTNAKEFVRELLKARMKENELDDLKEENDSLRRVGKIREEMVKSLTEELLKYKPKENWTVTPFPGGNE